MLSAMSSWLSETGSGCRFEHSERALKRACIWGMGAGSSLLSGAGGRVGGDGISVRDIVSGSSSSASGDCSEEALMSCM